MKLRNGTHLPCEINYTLIFPNAIIMHPCSPILLGNFKLFQASDKRLLNKVLSSDQNYYGIKMFYCIYHCNITGTYTVNSYAIGTVCYTQMYMAYRHCMCTSIFYKCDILAQWVRCHFC